MGNCQRKAAKDIRRDVRETIQYDNGTCNY